MSVLVSIALFSKMTNTLLWNLPGDVLAAPAPLSLPLGLSLCSKDFSAPETNFARRGFHPRVAGKV